MRVADSFKNYEYNESKAYEKNGKLYVKARCRCDRCGGTGIIASRVENGKIIPIPVDGGICYSCWGEKFVTKEIRLYTDKEYESMANSQAKQKAKKEAEREAKIKAEYETNRKEWLKENGFNDAETTYVYFPQDSFDMKDTLKQMGFIFNPILFWHIAEVPSGYEDKVVEIKFAEVAKMSAWGKGVYEEGSKQLVKGRMKAMIPASNSEWFGEEGKRERGIEVTLISIRPIETRFGTTDLIKFETEEGNVIHWWTSTCVEFERGAKLLLDGTVKKHDIDTYNNDEHVTVMTRCKLREA